MLSFTNLLHKLEQNIICDTPETLYFTASQNRFQTFFEYTIYPVNKISQIIASAQNLVDHV